MRVRESKIRYTLLLALVLVSACGRFATTDVDTGLQGPGTSVPSQTLPDGQEPGPDRALENGDDNKGTNRDSKPGENPATVTIDPNKADTQPTAEEPKAQGDSQKQATEEPDTKPELGSIMYTKGALKPEEIAESGYIEPTIYDFPIFNEDKNPCEEEVELLGLKGTAMLRVCPKTLSVCGEEGSCAIIKDGTRTAVNVKTRVSGKDRFFEIGEECPFGYGVRSICLDPFYTLAADLSRYTPGDVIFIPSIQGLALPNGAKHDGYFIIRDQGRGVKGKGRFDFFSGYFRWSNKYNPFTKIGLGSVNTHVPYYKVKGSRVEMVKTARGFPRLSAHPIDQFPTQ